MGIFNWSIWNVWHICLSFGISLLTLSITWWLHKYKHVILKIPLPRTLFSWHSKHSASSLLASCFTEKFFFFSKLLQAHAYLCLGCFPALLFECLPPEGRGENLGGMEKALTRLGCWRLPTLVGFQTGLEFQ